MAQGAQAINLSESRDANLVNHACSLVGADLFKFKQQVVRHDPSSEA